MGCGYDRSQQTKGDARLTPEDEEQPEPERLFAGLGRQLDAHWQMSDRSGPLYDLAKARGSIVHDAYKEAGSPSKIYRDRPLRPDPVCRCSAYEIAGHPVTPAARSRTRLAGRTGWRR